MADTPEGTGAESFASLDDAMGAWQPEEEENRAADTLDASDENPLPETPEDGDAADVEEYPDGEQPDDEEQGYSGGRFAADDAKVRLEDGQMVSVGELRRSFFREGDYTRSKQALAEERRSFEADRQRVSSLETELQQQRETVAFFAQHLMPKEPDPAMLESDFVGYHQMKAAYDKQVGLMQRLGVDFQAHQARRQAEVEKAMSDHIASERKLLREKATRIAPELASREGYEKFWVEAVKAGGLYGYTPEELNQLTDHRHYLILRDALAYRRIKAKNAQANRPNPQQQRPILRGSQRTSPNADKQQQRQAALARLNKSGSIHDAVNLID